MEEAKQRAVLIVGGDHGALSLVADHHVVAGQGVQRLSQGADTDLILLGQRRLAGDKGAGCPLSRDDALKQHLLDLLVERSVAEAWLIHAGSFFALGEARFFVASIARGKSS